MNTREPGGKERRALITLPNDPDLLPLAVEVVERMSRYHGLGHRATQELALAVSEAVDNVCLHAFRIDQDASFTVEVVPIPGGLEVSIKDKGAPYQPDLDPSGHSRGFAIMSDNVDNLSFTNLGHLGKEVRMVKMATGKTSWDQVEAPAFDRDTFSADSLEVRRMRAEDAIEVSRCFYDVYGYDYGDDKVYDPGRLAELNEQKLLLTIIAVSPEGYVLGTESLERSDTDTLIYEAGMAAVRPEAQHFGVGRAMAKFMHQVLKEERVPGVWAACVTSHTFSQRTVPPGCTACMLAPGNKPPDHTINPPQAQRNSVLYLYRDLNPKPPKPTLYVPLRHREICGKIFHGFGWEPIWGEKTEPELKDKTVASYDVNTSRGRVLGRVKQYGKDFEDRARQKHNFFRTHSFAANYALLPLSHPYTIEACELLEGWGYFFCGVFPGSGKNDPYLGMVFLNNQILDYDQIHVLDPFAQELKNYIRALDPEQLSP